MAKVRLSIDQVNSIVQALRQVAAATAMAGLHVETATVDRIADALADQANEAIRNGALEGVRGGGEATEEQ
jgi:hypothetical protein